MIAGAIMASGIVIGFAAGVSLSVLMFRRIPFPIIWPVIGMVV